MNINHLNKHIIVDIEGRRCTLIESGIDTERMLFLKGLLTFNGMEVMVEPSSEKDSVGGELFNLGVTSLLFNPLIAVYDLSLRMPDGRIVTPAIWNQETRISNVRYWRLKPNHQIK